LTSLDPGWYFTRPCMNCTNGGDLQPPSKKQRRAVGASPHATLLEIEQFRYKHVDYQVNQTWKYEEKRAAEQETDVLLPLALFDDAALKPTIAGPLPPHSEFLWRWDGAHFAVWMRHYFYVSRGGASAQHAGRAGAGSSTCCSITQQQLPFVHPAGTLKSIDRGAAKLCHELIRPTDAEEVVKQCLRFSLEPLATLAPAVAKRTDLCLCLHVRCCRSAMNTRPLSPNVCAALLCACRCIAQLDASSYPGSHVTLQPQQGLICSGSPMLQITARLGDSLFRDTVIWDVAQPLNTAEGYASAVCEGLGLRFDWFKPIEGAVQALLSDVREVCQARHQLCAVPALTPAAPAISGHKEGGRMLRWPGQRHSAAGEREGWVGASDPMA
jgi:SNF5 / SMARCB1 / INI1